MKRFLKTNYKIANILILCCFFLFIVSQPAYSLEFCCRLIRKASPCFLTVPLEKLVPVEAFRELALERGLIGSGDEIEVHGEITPENIKLTVKTNQGKFLGKLIMTVKNSLVFNFLYNYKYDSGDRLWTLEQDNHLFYYPEDSSLPHKVLPEEVLEALVTKNTNISYWPQEMALKYIKSTQTEIPENGWTSPEELVQRYGWLSEMEEHLENLTSFVEIEHFSLLNLLRGGGLAQDWYRELIEPYIKNSGFSMVAVRGTCWEQAPVKKFWSDMGYPERVATIPNLAEISRADHEFVQFFTSFKILP